MPNTVYLLGNNVFDGCGNIKSIYFSSGLKYIYANTFDGIGLYEKDGITSIDLSDIDAIKGHTFSGTSYDYLIKDNFTVTVIVDNEFISNTRENIGDTIKLYEKVGHTIQWEVSPSSLIIENYSFVMPSENVTLRGTSTPNKYTVSVFLNGGMIDEIPDGWTFNDNLYTKDCDYGTNAVLIERQFANAYKTQSDIEWISTTDTVTTYGLELTAKWTPKQYMITWCNEDGTILLQSKTEYGSVPKYTETTPIKNPTSSKVFTFSGWDSEPSAVEGEKTYHATYDESDRYYSIFADINGNITEVKTKYGDIPELPAEPTKPSTTYLSYAFEYWSPSVQSVTCDMTYVAVFSTSPREYTVTWVDDEGNVLDITTGLTYGSTPKYTKGEVTKEPTAEFSYTFSNWTPQVKAVSGDAVYAAVFESVRNTYTVVWKDDSGKVLEIDSEVEYGSAVQYNGDTPSKRPTAQYTYSFSGWDGMTAGMMVESDLVFTAKYFAFERTYTIAFNAEGNVTSSVLKYGEEIIAPEEDPTKESDEYFIYTFSHWIDFYEGVTVTQDATYYASFSSSPHVFTVTWMDDEGNVLDVSNGLTFGTVPVYTKGEVTKKPTAEFSYTFTNWTPQVKAVNGDAVYTALFEPTRNSYTVMWKDDSGKVLSTEEDMEYGSAVQYKGEIPIKSPTAQYTYVFAGWEGMTAGMIVESDLVFTAKYVSYDRMYTVSFNADGNVTSDSLKYGETIVAPEDPTKESDEYYRYTFSHWIDFYEGATVTQDVMYYAQFDTVGKDFHIRFNANEKVFYEYDGSFGSLVEGPKNSPMKQADTQFQYVFIGWDGFFKGITTVTGDMEFEAVFSQLAITHLIQFTVDGRVASVYSLPFGSEIIAPENPVKETTAQYEYTFLSWGTYYEGMKVTGPMIFEAQFFEKIRTYDVTFRYLDKENTAVYEYGEIIVAPADPVKPSDEMYDYTFSHWNGFNDGMTVSGKAIFTAVFEKTIKSLGSGNVVVLTMSEEDLLSLSDGDIEAVVSKMNSDNGSFTLDIDNGKIKFNTGSVKSFKWKNVKASVDEVSDNLTKEQKKAVGDRPVYDVTLSNKEGRIHKLEGDDGTGNIEITVRYDLKKGEDSKNLTVWYLDDDGGLTEKKNCEYYEEDGLGYISFVTEHLSNYAIMYTEGGTPDQNSGNDSTLSIGLIAGVCVAIIAVCAVAFVIYKRH